jgi:hypothetical protein
MQNGPDMFDKVRLPPELDSYLRTTNPWWEKKPGRVLPPYRRWAFEPMRRWSESPIAPIVVLRGARQVGKTIRDSCYYGRTGPNRRPADHTCLTSVVTPGAVKLPLQE